MSRENYVIWDCWVICRQGTKGVLDLIFIFIRYHFNLIRIFKDGAHGSKTEFMLGSGVNVSLRHWVVSKFAIHEHLLYCIYFACSFYESPESDNLSCEYHVQNPPASEGLWLGSKSFSGPGKHSTSLVPMYSSIPPHSLSSKTFLVTLFL